MLLEAFISRYISCLHVVVTVLALQVVKSESYRLGLSPNSWWMLSLSVVVVVFVSCLGLGGS